ncbi:MAG: protein-export chaperone SecB [Rhodothalassiaceae bacterium]
MAENDHPQGDGAAAPDMAEAPLAGLIAQYVKDLSFENPGAPDVLEKVGSGERPEMKVDLGLNASKHGEARYEVDLKIQVTSVRAGETIFVIELDYAGLFEVRNVPEAQLQLFLLVQAPNLLFPFVRRIVADLTQDGGFRPLLLDPIDFAALYQQRAQQMQQQQRSQVLASGSATGDTIN